MAGIRIKSNNFNGKSVEITFNPFTGGTIDLGTQTIPYDYLSSNYEGDYSIYIPEYDKTCPLQVGIPPSPTPTSSVTPTPTQTGTPTPTPSPSAPSVDPDAAAYLADVVASGGTTNPTIDAAVDTLFTDLKSAGLYSKMLAMYPYVGSTAASHSINALLNKTYDITWYGGMTHSISGSTGDGVNGYGDTGLITQDTIQDNYSFGFYQTTRNNAVKSEETIMGGSQFGSSSFPALQIMTDIFTSSYYFRSGDYTSTQINNGGNNDGFYIGNRTGSTTSELYRNGNLTPLITLTGNTYTEGGSNLSIYVFNFAAPTPYANGYANQTLAFTFVAEGLSGTDITNLSNTINTFQTSLGRNVY